MVKILAVTEKLILFTEASSDCLGACLLNQVSLWPLHLAKC